MCRFIASGRIGQSLLRLNLFFCLFFWFSLGEEEIVPPEAINRLSFAFVFLFYEPQASLVFFLG
jgi:hypothetical protein